ncbi:MAG TPA: hypothetical protein DCY88_04705 [Cyanobacteria bacterium UBA11372]|nr:hypothetical protein [Cyanobacteria bacterium UBA11372]
MNAIPIPTRQTRGIHSSNFGIFQPPIFSELCLLSIFCFTLNSPKSSISDFFQPTPMVLH